MLRKIVLLFSVLLLFSCSRWTSDKIKIACVGDSITYGYKLDNRKQDSYPGQLGKMLGSNYKVENFGVNGATVLFDGDLPYKDQEDYQH